MEIVEGLIVKADEYGVTVFIPQKHVDVRRLCLQKCQTVQVGIPDGRTITPEQRKKAHACLAEIAEWIGDLPEYVKRLMKMEFMANRMQALEKKLFSLSDCDMTTAREFISYLIDFMLEHDVPSRVPLYELCEDVGRYVYACLVHKHCAVCGRKAELHHVDRIGMGNDRTQVVHIGRRALPLCREHHVEVDQTGDAALCEKYHIQPVKIDELIAKTYKLGGKKNNGNKEHHIA